MSLEQLRVRISQIPISKFLGYFQAGLQYSSRYWNQVVIQGKPFLIFRDLQGVYRILDISRLAIISRFKLLSSLTHSMTHKNLELLIEAALSLPEEGLCQCRETMLINTQWVLPLFLGFKHHLPDADIAEDSPMSTFLVHFPEASRFVIACEREFSIIHNVSGQLTSVLKFDLHFDERVYGRSYIQEIRGRSTGAEQLYVLGANVFFGQKLFLGHDHQTFLVIGAIDTFTTVPKASESVHLKVASTHLFEGLALCARLVQEWRFIRGFSLQSDHHGLKLQLFDPDLEGMERINWVNQLYALLRESVIGEGVMEAELTKATFQEVMASDEFFNINENMIELNFPGEVHFCQTIIDYLLESSGHSVDFEIL